MTSKPIRPLLQGLFVVATACLLYAQQEPSGISAGPDAQPSLVASEPALTPALKLPSLPRITCQNNQLTIVADNATMGSILAALRPCLALEVIVPAGFAEERTYLHLGPGPAREVLETLLNASEYNYVIQSSSAAPAKVVTILLTPRSKDGSDPKDSSLMAQSSSLIMTPARRVWLAARNSARPSQPPSGNEESSPEAETDPVQPAPAESTSTVPNDAVAATEIIPPADATDHAKENPGSPSVPVQAPAAPMDPATVTSSSTATQADSSSPDTPAKVLQGQIGLMQQMFEERRKMIANPPPTAPLQ